MNQSVLYLPSNLYPGKSEQGHNQKVRNKANIALLVRALVRVSVYTPTESGTVPAWEGADWDLM